MKVRWTTACVRCGVLIPSGAQATRIYGHLWHTACWVAYARERAKVPA